MNKLEESSVKKQSLITVSQFAFIIFGSIVAAGVLSLPNGSVKISHQDGWISTLIGGIYPLYIVIISGYISKKFPDDTILVLSKKYYGKFFGSIFNFIFATYCVFFGTMVANYYTNLMRSYVTGFLTPLKMIAIIFILIIYAVSKGIKIIGIISEITFYLTIIMILSPIPAIRYGNIINLYPIFGSGFSSIVKGSVASIYSYSGAELILLIHPFLKEKNKILTSSLMSVIMVIFVYVWCVFITTYYLGPYIVNKSYWSFLLVTQSVTISVINNYKFIFIFLWSLIALRSITIFSYASVYILKELVHKIEVKKICILIYPLLVYIALKYGNETSRSNISDKVTPCYIVFNLLYITVIAVLIFFRGDAKE